MRKLMLAVFLTAGAILFSQTPTRLNDSTFVYPCVTTTGTDYNFVGLPFQTSFTKGSDFDPSGTNIETVSRFDAATQMTETGVYSSVFGWCKDIPVQTGGAYGISVKNNFDFVVVGDSVSVVYNLINNATNTDYNYIVHPLVKAGITTSKDLGNDIGTANCYTISKWNPNTQAFQISNLLVANWLNPFSTTTGQTLMVTTKKNYTWPTGKVYDGDISENETSMTEKNAKGHPARARVFFYHVVKETGSGTEEMVFPDELSNDDSKQKLKFKAWITSRPAELLTQDSFDCGYMNFSGLSVVYLNIANFVTPWSAGDALNIEFPKFGDMIFNKDTFTLTNESGAVFRSFSPYYAGSTAFVMPLVPSGITDVNIPSEITLSQNYPNPFNPETEISFSLPKEDRVKLSVFNSDGQLVKELVNNKVSAGNHSVNFNAENLNSGIYFYTLETRSSKLNKKMLLIK